MIQGSSLYRASANVLRVLVRMFFRRVEVSGLENLPSSGGGIFIAWHPNALLDGTLILSQYPGRIVVGARHGLFRWPILGWMMRALGVVPVYRRRDFSLDVDGAVLREANRKSLDAMARAVVEGAFALLFPEGQSHDAPYPTELKTGAARLYHRARELTPSGGPLPVIIPVGLHYDQKSLFRSSVLVIFHSPLELEEPVANPPASTASEDERRAHYRALTDTLEQTLRDVAHATESWDLHHTMHRARKLFRAEYAHRRGKTLERPDMKERVLAFRRVWAGYNERLRTHPREVERMVARIREYDRDLRALGVEDHELYATGKFSIGLAFRIALQAFLVYFVLPPLFLIGYVVNLPAGLLVWATSKWAAGEPKDIASSKLVVGALAFPLTWLAVALLVGWGHTRLSGLYPQISQAPVLTGALAFVSSAVSAYVVLHYQMLARQTFRAVRVRLTRWRRSHALAALRAERASLFDELTRLSQAG
ncbi:MAG TPA: 1-acyl-sn-glycerol-3-phosphate acyltransferase [Vicinamibacteria bacterium]|nr:1-acyl-sn-glycerol-3-phosphate acyltransferase [Vicinamibacteria bacterium]